MTWGGKVYFGSVDGYLYALYAATGKPVAGFPKYLGSEVLHSSPVVGNGTVYVATAGNDRALYAFNASTGNEIAGFPIFFGGPIYAPLTLYGGNIYVSSNEGKVYAFSATTGAPISGYPVNTDSGGIPNYQFGGAVSAAQNRIFVGSWVDCKMRAFDALTGAAIPGYPPSPQGCIESTPAIAGGRVFYSASAAYLHGLRLDRGTPLSGFPLTVVNYVVRSSPALGSGHLIVGTVDNRVHSYNPVGGALQWKTVVDSAVNASPVIANGVVFVNSSSSLYALDLSTGAPLWQYPIDTSDYASPVAADGIIFLDSTDGYLYAFSINGSAPARRLAGGELGICPALSSLKPDLSLKPSRN